MLAQGHPVFGAVGSPTVQMRGVASNVLEFARRAARGPARSTPNLFYCWLHPPPWVNASGRWGCGHLVLERGKKRNWPSRFRVPSLQQDGDQGIRCFRCGVRTGQLGLTRVTSTGTTEHGLGKLRTAQGSDEQERLGNEIRMKREKGLLLQCLVPQRH